MSRNQQLSHAEQIAWQKKCILEDWLEEEAFRLKLMLSTFRRAFEEE